MGAGRALFTRRRKEAYEALHPETKGQVRQANVRWHADANLALAFTADTAAKTGQSARMIQRDATRAAKVAPRNKTERAATLASVRIVAPAVAPNTKS